MDLKNTIEVITIPKDNRTRVLLLSMPDTFMGFSLAAKLPNIGLVSIAANVDKDECVVGVVDLVLRRHRVFACLKNILKRFDPEIVGLNAMTFQWPTARSIAKWIKEEYNPNIKIILGGYHASTAWEEISENVPNAENAPPTDYFAMRTCPWADFIVRGEGEATFREFIHAYRNKLPYDNIKGLSWRDSNRVFHHNPRRDPLDLKDIKLPDRSARLIIKHYHGAGKVADCVETSRGCTNVCKFCSIREMYGRNAGIRYYDIERVIQDIRNCSDIGARNIVFIDDNITCDPDRLIKICDRIIEEKKKGTINKQIEFFTQASAHGLISRKELIPKMGKAGFGIVFFGIESVKKETLKDFKKSIPQAQKMKDLVTNLHKNHMVSFGGFILGNPKDTLQDLRNNIAYAKYLDLDVPAYQILTPFPKTEIRDELKKDGLLVNEYDYSKYHGLFSNIKSFYLSQDELQHETLRTYYHYFRPKWFISRLKRVDVIKRYWHYMFLILKKYGSLAIHSWYKEYLVRKHGLSEFKAEDKVIKQFEQFRDVRLGSMLKK